MSGLAGFARYPQFILWKSVPRADGRTDKLPCDPLGNPSNAHNPANWMPEAQAIQRAQDLGLGVGFVFTARDPFFFIDIDNCREGDGWNTTAVDLCRRFAGAAVEVSQSGSGLHIFGTANPIPPHRCKGAGFDLYTDTRFAALTWSGVTGDVWTDHTVALGALIGEFLPPEAGGAEGWTDAPCEGWAGPEDDEELIARAMRSSSGASVFGGKASFADLWTANADVLGTCYPDDHGGRPFDHSAADAALCAHLAFWTGKDCARIDRLVRSSALMREKWDEREDYRERTILGAVAGCKAVYSRGAPAVAPETPRNGSHLMLHHEQPTHFAGCIYVRSLHRVYVPDGALLKPDQFSATYGGHLFGLDRDTAKTTKSAFEALTQSLTNRYEWAQGVCFRPECPPGEVVVDAGRRLVNTYKPAQVACTEGDVGPFLGLLAKLLPDERDRSILLAWMAALVQYPGTKFQWSPLLQGVEGNGKSAVLRVLAEAVGWEHVHLPNAKELDNKFTGWLAGKIFIGVEEIKARDRWETMEALKPLITNPQIEIQYKGADQIVGDNRANFLMCSNHRDAILKGRGDRRYCVFFTAQQEFEDLARDGMTGAYFPNLYHWLRACGYAHMTHWLRNYAIPDELNPAGSCHRAPDTTSTADVLQLSRGPVEQEILAAIDEERPGFRGGWVSSIAVDELIQGMKGKGVSRNKRKDILGDLGYVWHPSLPRGRSPKMTARDGGRPRLYVQRGGALWVAGVDTKTVIAGYEAAQMI